MVAPTLQGTPTTGGRNGSGTFTVTLPTGASGYVLAVAGNGGDFTSGFGAFGAAPEGWTFIGQVERTGSGGKCRIYTGVTGASTAWEAFDSSTGGPIVWTITGFNSGVLMQHLTTPGNQSTTSPSITTTATCYTMRGVFDMSDPTGVATYPSAANLGRSNARQEHASEGWWATVALAYQNDTTIGSSGTASWSVNGSYEPVAFTAQVTAVVVPNAPSGLEVTGGTREVTVDFDSVAGADSYELRWRRTDLTPPAVSTQTSAPPHLDRLDDATGLDGTYTYTYDGSDVRTYILDSGIRYTHNEFTGRTAPGYSLQSAYDDDSTHNHGTGVAAMAAGTIYGAAKAATVISITIDGSEDEVPASQLSDAAAWIATDRAGAPAVAVLASGFDGEASPSGPMLAALQEFWDQGVVLVNSGVGESGSPFPDVDNGLVIVAGASDHTTDAKASYSGYGPGFDLYAPIGTTTTASSTSNSATRSAGGTSEAAPLIAGVIAKILHANPALQPARVREVLFSQARQGILSGIPSGPNRLLNGNANTDQWSTSIAPSTTFDLDGLDDDATYEIQVRTIDGGLASAWSTSDTATTESASTPGVITATTGDTTAAGGTATAAAGGTITLTPGDATAAAGTATLNVPGTITTTSGDATATGGTAALATPGTITTTDGTVTAAGGQATLTGAASATITTTTGTVVADAGTAALTAGGTVTATTGTGTVDGDTATVTAAATLTVTAGDGAAAGGPSTLIGGAASTINATTGTAIATGGTAQPTTPGTLTGITGTGTADGGFASLMAGAAATITPTTGDATATGGTGLLTAGTAIVITNPGNTTAAGGTATVTAAVLVTVNPGDVIAAGGDATMLGLIPAHSIVLRTRSQMSTQTIASSESSHITRTNAASVVIQTRSVAP